MIQAIDMAYSYNRNYHPEEAKRAEPKPLLGPHVEPSDQNSDETRREIVCEDSSGVQIPDLSKRASGA
jgi:hypothetical protein